MAYAIWLPQARAALEAVQAPWSKEMTDQGLEPEVRIPDPGRSANPPEDAVRGQLEKILGSASFKNAERLSRFFFFVVDEALKHPGETLKEYRVALDVFDRPPAFDPRKDSVVRVAARQLRTKLKEYYDSEGKADLIRIDLPKGGYHPVFHPGQAAQPEPGAKTVASRRIPTRTLVAAGLLLSVALVTLWWMKSRPRTASGVTTIAVLPFDNYSADPENAYFCDGLVEELTSALSKVRGFQVLARTTAGQFKKTKDPVQTARELKVEAIIEGSVRKSGTRLRVAAQLIKASDGYHLWSETYERESRDAFAIQDELVSNIVRALSEKVGANFSRPAPSTQKSEAVNLYWKGRYLRRQRDADAIPKSTSCFEQAVREDPQYAAAWAALGDCYAIMGLHQFGAIAPAELVARARSASDKALVLDGTMAEAYGTRAMIKFYYDFDWPGAEQDFKKALQINPSSTHIRQLYALGLMSRARFPESIQESLLSRQLDPLSYIVSVDLAVSYYCAGRYDDSIASARLSLSTDPSYAPAHAIIGCCHSARGEYGTAIDEFRAALSGSERHSYLLGQLGRAQALSGNRAEAMKLLKELEDAPDQTSISFVHVAYIYAGLREKGRALDFLEKAWERHDADVIFMRIDPALGSLRSEPRFNNLLKKSRLLP
jgi:adenylate cyclase